MALVPIANQPGLFKDTTTDRVVNMRDVIPWETSDKFEGQDYVFKNCGHDGVMIAVHGCRVSFAEPPSRLALQQLTVLMVNSRVEAIASLERWCTDNVFKIGGYEKTFTLSGRNTLRVALSERPVEDCGLRVHLRGVKSCHSCYG